MTKSSLLLLSLLLASVASAGPEVWVPPDYGSSDTPVQPCQADITVCYPVLFVWPDGVLHKKNLVGVKFAFYNPPYSNSIPPWKPVSHRVVWCNYWKSGDGPLAVGDTLQYAGLGVVWLSNSLDPDTTKVKDSRAWIESIEDSVITMKASVLFSCNKWSKDQADTTTFRLVSPNWTRLLVGTP